MIQIPSVPVADVSDPLPPGLAVLDVREPLEWQHGHIEGAVHVPLMELPQRFQELPVGPLLVVCRVGARSAQATAYLAQQGLDATNLDGGMLDWAEAGRPMVSETGTTAQVV